MQIEPSWGRQDLVRAMRGRAAELSSQHADQLVAATWDLGIVPSSTLGHRLRPDSAAWISDMTEAMREGNGNIIVAGFHWDTPFDESSIDEESLRGSFLRRLRSLLEEKEVAALLRESLPADLPAALAKRLSSEDAAAIAMLVDQTASLGDFLLDGAEHCNPASSDDLEAA